MTKLFDAIVMGLLWVLWLKEKIRVVKIVKPLINQFLLKLLMSLICR